MNREEFEQVAERYRAQGSPYPAIMALREIQEGKENVDPDLEALSRFYTSAIEESGLTGEPYRYSLTYDLSLVPEYLRDAVRTDLERTFRRAVDRVEVDLIRYSDPPPKILVTGMQYQPVRNILTKDERDAMMRQILGISGPSPWTPGTTSTSTPASKEPSSSSTNSESSEVEPGPKPS